MIIVNISLKKENEQADAPGQLEKRLANLAHTCILLSFARLLDPARFRSRRHFSAALF